MQIERHCHREKGMSCLLHLPFRWCPFSVFLFFPFPFPNLSPLPKPEKRHQPEPTPSSRKVRGSSGMRLCHARAHVTSLPNVLRAQWAVGGLSARQKGLAAKWGRSQPS